MLIDLIQELNYAFALGCHRLEDRGLPLPFPVQPQHCFQHGNRPVGIRVIGFVYAEHIADFQNPGFDRLDIVTQTRSHYNQN